MAGRATGHVRLVHRDRGDQFYLKYRLPDGLGVQKLLGPAWSGRGRPPAGYHTRRMAEEALQTILADARRGTLDRVKTGATFADAAAEWLRYVEHDRKRRPSTVRDYRNAIGGRLVPEFGDEPLEAIDVDRIDRWRSALLADGKLSPRTINKYLVMLHGIFKRAMRVYGLPRNPVAQVERLPLRRSNRIQFLTLEEVEALVRAIRDAPAYDPDQDAALIVTAAMTGLRWNELRQLLWRDVDFGGALVHVRHQTKSEYARSVPLIDRVAAVLDALSRRSLWTGQDDPVFVTEVGTPIDYSKSTKAYRKARKAAGVQAVRFHDLRHVFGTYAVRNNPVTDVKAWMGHADLATTMVYVHYVPQHRAARRLGRAFEAEADPLVEGDVSRGVSRTGEI